MAESAWRQKGRCRREERDPERETDGDRLGLGEREIQGTGDRGRDGRGIQNKLEEIRGARLRRTEEVREKGAPCPLPRQRPQPPLPTPIPISKPPPHPH